MWRQSRRIRNDDLSFIARAAVTLLPRGLIVLPQYMNCISLVTDSLAPLMLCHMYHLLFSFLVYSEIMRHLSEWRMSSKNVLSFFRFAEFYFTYPVILHKKRLLNF
jgi:hypothetical protein